MSNVDFKTFMRILDSVSRLTNIYCFASIDCNCRFLVKDVSKGESYNV